MLIFLLPNFINICVVGLLVCHVLRSSNIHSVGERLAGRHGNDNFTRTGNLCMVTIVLHLPSPTMSPLPCKIVYRNTLKISRIPIIARSSWDDLNIKQRTPSSRTLNQFKDNSFRGDKSVFRYGERDLIRLWGAIPITVPVILL